MLNYTIDFAAKGKENKIRQKVCVYKTQKRELGESPKRSGHCIQGVKPGSVQL